jgi:hypothetical protein
MKHVDFNNIINGLKQGEVLPYLGPGALTGVMNTSTGEPIPAESEALILAMNKGKPMAPKLMYEFSRAAMNLELKRGRRFINQFLTQLYGNTQWTRAPLHAWLASLNLPYLIDINRDTQLQQEYAHRPHILIVGIARIGGTDYRFRLYHYDSQQYRAINLDEVDTQLPVLFKPLGTPLPEPSYIASDADYVDFLTELMGGFGIPIFIKNYRRDKRYLLLGLRLTRDTERMILSDMIYDAASPHSGWALIPEPTEKEKRFCGKLGLEIIELSVEEWLAEMNQ